MVNKMSRHVAFLVLFNCNYFLALGHDLITTKIILLVYDMYCFGSGYFAVDGNLPSETILP